MRLSPEEKARRKAAREEEEIRRSALFPWGNLSHYGSSPGDYAAVVVRGGEGDFLEVIVGENHFEEAEDEGTGKVARAYIQFSIEQLVRFIVALVARYNAMVRDANAEVTGLIVETLATMPQPEVASEPSESSSFLPPGGPVDPTKDGGNAK